MEDSTIYYFANDFAEAPSTTVSLARTYIPFNGTITNVRINTYCGTTNATTGTAYLRLNNTQDYTISSSFSWANTFNTVSTDLNQAVSAGDYYEFKIVTPSFSDPNPATVRMSGYVTIRS